MLWGQTPQSIASSENQTKCSFILRVVFFLYAENTLRTKITLCREFKDCRAYNEVVINFYTTLFYWFSKLNEIIYVYFRLTTYNFLYFVICNKYLWQVTENSAAPFYSIYIFQAEGYPSLICARPCVST